MKNGPIIIVDDDSEDQELIIECIKEMGFLNPVISFYNGKEALDYLSATSDKPFIILCDMNMPVMDGLVLRNKINNDEALRKKSIPFIFFSTNAIPITVNKAYELAVQGFFEKPISFSGLKSLIKMILDYWSECKHPNTFN